jgi:hypothetical protein
MKWKIFGGSLKVQIYQYLQNKITVWDEKILMRHEVLT